jgi:hypothetical protein
MFNTLKNEMSKVKYDPFESAVENVRYFLEHTYYLCHTWPFTSHLIYSFRPDLIYSFRPDLIYSFRPHLIYSFRPDLI